MTEKTCSRDDDLKSVDTRKTSSSLFSRDRLYPFMFACMRVFTPPLLWRLFALSNNSRQPRVLVLFFSCPRRAEEISGFVDSAVLSVCSPWECAATPFHIISGLPRDLLSFITYVLFVCFCFNCTCTLQFVYYLVFLKFYVQCNPACADKVFRK